jgi:hypothetical protein
MFGFFKTLGHTSLRKRSSPRRRASHRPVFDQLGGSGAPLSHKHRAHLEVEALEERAMPSILFTPQLGAETAATGGQVAGNVAPGVPMYTIFLGPYWSTASGRSYANVIQNSLTPLFTNSGYLDGLRQYGVTQRAYVPANVTNEVFNYDDPGPAVSDRAVQYFVRNAIMNQGLPQPASGMPEGMYFVFTAPGVTSSTNPDATGYHDHTSGPNGDLLYAWISTASGSNVDYVTNIVSHELVEALTDPSVGSGWEVITPPFVVSNDVELCDNEAQSYSYRVNGYLAQSYWSQQDSAYRVNDGNFQKFTVSGGQLIINGDQFVTNDIITIDLNNAGGVSVNLNGEIASFDNGVISSIVVNTRGGTNTVSVKNEAAGVPLTINASASDSIHIGSGGSVQGIQAPVTIYGSPSVVLDDASDGAARSVIVNSDNSITGLAPATISFQNSVASLTINAGFGGNTFNVHNTPAANTTINTASGDTVNVYSTTANLSINGHGPSTVDVGTFSSLAAINGTISVSASTGAVSLFVDDRGDTSSRIFSLTDTTLSWGTGASVQWTAQTFASGGVNYVGIYGSGAAAGSTYNVSNTPHLFQSTYLNTGPGSDTVNVNGTGGELDVYNPAGQDYVYVGNGTLAGINGLVNVYGNGSTYLYVQDGNDSTVRTATMSAYALTGLSAGTIEWSPTPNATNGVTSLIIAGPSAGSTYNVNNTPNLYFSTSLDTGAGGDTVNVNGTTGSLYVYNGGGQDSVNVGNGTLAAINALVDAYGPGSTYLYVKDGSDATTHTATLTSSSLTGLSTGTILWTPSATATGGVTFVDIFGPSAGSTYNINNTPSIYNSTLLNTGSGSDTVNVNGTSGMLNVNNAGGQDYVSVGNGTLAAINAQVDVFGLGSTYLYVKDGSDAATHAATLTSSSLTGLSTGTILWTPTASSTGGVTYLYITGSSVGSTYNVNNTSSLYYYTVLSTGTGSDTVNINGTTGTLYVSNGGGQDLVSVGNGTLAGINGQVNVNGYGSTYLYIKDGNDTTTRNAFLGSTALTGLSTGTIQWTRTTSSTGGVTYMQIYGTSVASTYNINNTPSLYYYTYLNTGTGSDTVNVNVTTGSLYIVNGGGQDSVNVGNGTLTAIQGLVYPFGSGTIAMTVNDANDATGRNATLTNNQLTGLAPATISYGSDVATLVINAGTGNDTLGVTSTSAGTQVTFNGGAGSDTLAGANITNAWNITGTNAGNLNGTVAFSAVEKLTGGSGVDTFRFTTAASQVFTVNGGGAPAGQGDWLDYSAYPAFVAVNLSTGQATGVTGTGTLSNIRNVFGSNFGNSLIGNAQGNILIGGNGADTINGGSGRNLLIGGRGNDSITGGGAGAGDILIGGYTSYDQALNEAALMSILAEWQSADSYATRISALRGGAYPLALGSTVLDDGGTDRLYGFGSANWFFKGSNATILGYQIGEVIN